MVDSKQTFLTPSVMMGAGKSSTLQAYAFNPDHARNQLARMIIMHEYPLSTVEHLGFKRFCCALQPLFHVVCRNTIKKDILMIYKVERKKTMRLLERNQGRVSFTMDVWTTSNQKRGFMAITAHFIDDSWKLQSRILRKLSTLTVDNCSTNDAIINLLLEKFGSDHLWFKSSFHVRCAAHILNLIVNDGLNVIKSSIEKVRDSVAYWTATPKREEKFEDAAHQLGVFCGKKLSLDCPTRWNSTYLMLLTAIKYRSAFGRLELKDPQYKRCPNDDWNMAIDICERLKVFYEVTLLFSGTSYPTSNLFFKSVCEIKMKLSEWVLCENFVVLEMALKMIEKYDKYWENSHGFLGVAAALDPRFKMSVIEYYYSSIYGEHDDEMIESIRRRCFNLLTIYEGKNKNDSASASKPPASTTEVNNFDSFEMFLNAKKKVKSAHVQLELDHYLEDDLLPRHESFDILTWWKSSGLKYPTLEAIAQDVLAVPISIVASEFSFSTGGRVITPNRNRLNPKTLEALMCEATIPRNPFPNINDDDKDVEECVSGASCVTYVGDD
ncbi:hypothetical protein RHSIM_Rhsim06G0015900 [Rhododendron simsii]|uniref:Transposase n=1 Tax=Rhododendron simsii TaxID=118357 RepID=A0A834GRH8_RHOSS|nr:hypothetical protein RHSIM_Rhsim06G0015900 [Rhododendron simsii]